VDIYTSKILLKNKSLELRQRNSLSQQTMDELSLTILANERKYPSINSTDILYIILTGQCERILVA